MSEYVNGWCRKHGNVKFDEGQCMICLDEDHGLSQSIINEVLWRLADDCIKPNESAIATFSDGGDWEAVVVKDVVYIDDAIYIYVFGRNESVNEIAPFNALLVGLSSDESDSVGRWGFPEFEDIVNKFI